jgi:hypothetical protein
MQQELSKMASKRNRIIDPLQKHRINSSFFRLHTKELYETGDLLPNGIPSMLFELEIVTVSKQAECSGCAQMQEETLQQRHMQPAVTADSLDATL